jgi:hypothetical protein
MIEININSDCGNSPRKLFLKKLTVANAKGDLSFVIDNISKNISWEVLGNRRVVVYEDYIKEIVESKIWKVKNLIVDTIITHGTDASLSGLFITKENIRYSFCDIYSFKGAGGVQIEIN